MATIIGNATTTPSSYINEFEQLNTKLDEISAKLEGAEVQPTLQEKTVTENGTVTPDEGYDGLSKVTVNIDTSIPDGYIIPEGSTTITTNGSHDIAEYATVDVNVPIPDGYIVPTGSTTITENGTHDVTEFASAIINVPQLDTSDATATAADMLKGKTSYVNGIIVTGEIETYAGELVDNSTSTDMTIAAGTYVCIDSPDTMPSIDLYGTYPLSFKSNGVNYTSIYTDHNGYDFVLIKYGSTRVYSEDNEGWINTAYKTITLDTDQTVSAEFGEWFNSNYTKQAQGDISFTIDSTTYYADNGMTWGQWVSSSYNTGGFYQINNYTIKSADGGNVQYNYSDVNYSETIQQNVAYVVRYNTSND